MSSLPTSASSPGKHGFWGKIFSNRPKPPPAPAGAVFGVALHESLKYASIAISQVGPDGEKKVYGHIPVVVAKAGLFLKSSGTMTPGIFRVSGSNKRIKDLEQIFDTPPTYGKDLVWNSYSVHDAASAFRRYLNMLPYPIVPFELYGAFQDALPRTPNPLSSSQIATAVERYRVLINSLPPSSQHIFFYTLDLLSIFHRNADTNLMPASNLATIFQPGLLRHPPAPPRTLVFADGSPDPNAVKAQVEADATEHRRSQEVLVFLIEHQDAFELALPGVVPQKGIEPPPAGASQTPSASSALAVQRAESAPTATAGTVGVVTSEHSPSKTQTSEARNLREYAPPASIDTPSAASVDREQGAPSSITSRIETGKEMRRMEMEPPPLPDQISRSLPNLP